MGLITATLVAVGAQGTLHEVTLRLPDVLSLALGGWVTAMSGLQRLSADGGHSFINISGDWCGLTALQSLQMDSRCIEWAAGARLPLSLTHLSLCALNDEDAEGLATQVGWRW